MPKPDKFSGKVILNYGYCSKRGEYTKKDLDEINLIDSDQLEFPDIIIDDNKIQIFNSKTRNFEDLEVEDCKIDGNMLEINNNLYTYIKEDDIFISLNYDNINVILKVFLINDKCEHCKNEDEWLIKYCDRWLCCSCIFDYKECSIRYGYGF